MIGLILAGAAFLFVTMLPLFLMAAAVSKPRPPSNSREAE